MDYQYLTDLQLFKPPATIKVKILRIWKSTTPDNPENRLSLDFLIADAKKNVMQAMVRGFDAPLFRLILKEGSIYLIDKYRVMKSKHNFNVLPEDLMIVLSRMSKLKEVVEDSSQYPDYYFNFVHFKDLPHKIYKKKVLTDFVGMVTTITPVTKVQLNNRDIPVQKRDIYIQNASCESLKVVLYGDIALSVEEQEILQRNTNVVLVFTKLMIKTYMPGLRFCAGKFLCPIHDEKTPVLTMIQELTIEDLIGKIQLLAFGQQTEKLIGATIGELAVIKTINKMVLPPPVKALINTRRTFKVGLTGKAIEAGLTIFKIFDSTN
ncbi:Uncharacterized protein TCM_029362 [Theobroma cacao]|uniref:Replication protein A 70 kDa DNA-binding subunit B/D first OB fold domain-containing protein n=1 Tax=Theobroma cacao TaxID=3641 RepID=A0A061GKB2_THECC|nr:Uncharacterized protein TCM_029362 [Theobroma cacao]